MKLTEIVNELLKDENIEALSLNELMLYVANKQLELANIMLNKEPSKKVAEKLDMLSYLTSNEILNNPAIVNRYFVNQGISAVIKHKIFKLEENMKAETNLDKLSNRQQLIELYESK